MTKDKLRILMVSFPNLRSKLTPLEFLENATTINNYVKIYQQQSIKLSLFISFHTNHQIQYEGVSINFICEDKLYISKFKNLYKAIESISYDIIHLHNFLDVKSNLRLLRKIQSNVPVLLQNHGEMPPRKMLKKVLVKKLLSRVDSLLFAAPGQEEDWVLNGFIQDRNISCFCWEDFSKFEESTTEIRPKSLDISPIILWVANLDKNKDPLTALDGFEQFLQENKAQLKMIYKGTGLEEEVKQKIDSSQLLTENVELIGPLSPDDLYIQYQEAVYILQASYKEGSGYSITEALSCGLIPILSDIPSFRFLCKDGELGALFSRGNASSVKKALVDAFNKNRDEQENLALQHYQQNFSSTAIAKKLLFVYNDMLGK